MDPVLLFDPISFTYRKPNPHEVQRLKASAQMVPVARTSRLRCLNTYWEQGLAGTKPQLFARDSVVTALENAIDRLPEEFEFWIFDAFRSIETQKALFAKIFAEQKALNPERRDEEIKALTSQFVVNPDDTGRFMVPPHNSGGAVDLVLAYGGQALDMGTMFDEVSEKSATDWFERPFDPRNGMSLSRFQGIQKNRRILFNLLKDAGFVNYPEEWWHYDLGDCLWAETHSETWFYPAHEEGMQCFNSDADV